MFGLQDKSEDDEEEEDDEEDDDDDGSPSDVVTLTNDNFATEVSDDKDVMVEFYAPWSADSAATLWTPFSHT